MKKTTFNILFDEDKASALVLYLSQKARPPKRSWKKRSTRSTAKPCLRVCVILSI